MDEIAELLAFVLVGFFVMDALSNNDSTNGLSVPFDEPEPSFTGTENIMTPNMSTPGKLIQFANAIFNFEGGQPGDLNVRNNNPGNLKAAPDQFTGSPTSHDDKGFVIFPSLDAGFAALYNQLNKTISEYPQLNLQQFFARYLGQPDFLNPRPTSEGNPFTYAQTVADQLGVSATDTLGSIFGG